MKRSLLFVALVIVIVLTAVWIVLANFNLSALPEPGARENYVATQAKHRLIASASKHDIPPRPLDRAASAAEGDKVYAIRCSLCHGEDGHTISPMGNWMYPRAADLTSTTVQSYSDEELFWIVKNGIRLSGMPGFARLENDDHLWNVVDHLRALRSPGK